MTTQDGESKPLLLEMSNRASRRFEQREQNLVDKIEEHKDHGGGGHHGVQEPNILTAAAAAIINYLLMFGLCCAFGMIMFSNDFNDKHRAIAVKASLATALIMGLVAATWSTCPVAIGGTDLNPIVFMGLFAKTVGEAVAKHNNLWSPYLDAVGKSSSCHVRLLGDHGHEMHGHALHGHAVHAAHDACVPGAGQFCGCDFGHEEDCMAYHEELRATMIFTVAVSSAFIGSIYFVMGKYELAKYVAYVPTGISDAFLSCVGYKVFKYALKFSNWSLSQFVPAAIMGVLLYFLKAYHVGKPAIVMPLGILVPLGLFWAGVYLMGSNAEEARLNGYLFPEMTDVHFWEIWTDSYGKPHRINLRAWAATIPDLLIMAIVCVLDAALKVAALEGKMPVKVRKNYELRVYGRGNFLTTLCGAPVGYQQLKFTVINNGVMGNVTDKRAGIIYAVLCGATFFTSIAHFNYLPRAFLSMLLFFAGAGFVAENLWGSRKNHSFAEWMEVVAILGAYIISHELLFAVMTGCVLCGFSFIRKYAKVSAIDGRLLRGNQIKFTRKPEDKLLHESVQHMLEAWLLVVKLKGFVFFASAQTIIDSINKMFNEENDLPQYMKLRYLILDCKLLDGIDASGVSAMETLQKECKSKRVRLIWSSIDKARGEDFHQRGILHKATDGFKDLDSALLSVYNQARERRREHQKWWLMLHDEFKANNSAWHERMQYDPFGTVLTVATRGGVPWAYCTVLPIKKNKTILFEDKTLGKPLYLIHSGEVGIFSEDQPADRSNGEAADDPQPVAIYTRGWFLNLNAITAMPTDGCAVALKDGYVIAFDQDLWFKMSYERPLMMTDLIRAVVRQVAWEEEETQKVAKANSTFNWEEFASGAEVSTKNSMEPPEHYDALTMDSGVNQDVALESMPLVKARLNEVHVAVTLFDDGYFSNDAASSGCELPELPMAISKGLDAAFYTFAKDEGGKPVLKATDVERTLYYAGIFNGQRVAVTKDMELEEFKQLGRTSVFHFLGVDKVTKLKKRFEDADSNKNGILDMKEMSEALTSFLKVQVDLQLVQSLALTFAAISTKNGPGFNCQSFLQVVSWLVKECEAKWAVINALHKICNSQRKLTVDVLQTEQLTSQKLQQACGSITEDEANEMLWAADWFRKSHTSETKSLSLDACWCAIITQFWQIHQESSSCNLPLEPILDFDSWKEARGGRVSNKGSILQSGSPRWLNDPTEGDERQEVPNKFREFEEHLEKEDPPQPAACLSYISIFFILVSCLEIMVWPLIDDAIPGEHKKALETVLYIIEAVVTMVFIIELVARTVLHVLACNNSCGSAFEFLFFPKYALFDLVAVLPFLVELAAKGQEETKMLRLFRLVRLARFARLTKVAERRFPLMAAVSVVFVVIWCIYLLHQYEHAAHAGGAHGGGGH